MMLTFFNEKFLQQENISKIFITTLCWFQPKRMLYIECCNLNYLPFNYITIVINVFWMKTGVKINRSNFFHKDKKICKQI